MTRRQQWHVSGWRAILLAPVVLPAALIAGLWSLIRGRSSYAELTAREVAGYLEGFLEDGGAEWDWDDFVSIPIRDPELDLIRREAGRIPLPVDAQGLKALRALKAKAEALA